MQFKKPWEHPHCNPFFTSKEEKAFVKETLSDMQNQTAIEPSQVFEAMHQTGKEKPELQFDILCEMNVRLCMMLQRMYIEKNPSHGHRRS